MAADDAFAGLGQRMLPDLPAHHLLPARTVRTGPRGLFLHAALLAGTHKLSLNTGHLARRDQAATARYCAQVSSDFNAGLVRDDAVYLLNRGLIQALPRQCQAASRVCRSRWHSDRVLLSRRISDGRHWPTFGSRCPTRPTCLTCPDLPVSCLPAPESVRAERIPGKRTSPCSTYARAREPPHSQWNSQRPPTAFELLGIAQQGRRARPDRYASTMSAFADVCRGEAREIPRGQSPRQYAK